MILPLALSTPQWGLLAVLYFVMLVALGITSLRKGHWIMFLIGIAIPLFWLIGALIPPVDRRD